MARLAPALRELHQLHTLNLYSKHSWGGRGPGTPREGARAEGLAASSHNVHVDMGVCVCG